MFECCAAIPEIGTICLHLSQKIQVSIYGLHFFFLKKA